MTLLCLGLNHRTAPVEYRERLSYPPEALKAALARFGCGHESRPTGLNELVILSTCNRLELYARHTGPAADEVALFAPLVRFLAETHAWAEVEVDTHFYRLSNQAVATHLCRVAAGLDSMILGEPQILGQVAEAHQQASSHGAAGTVLNTLFRCAIRAGKRAHAETAISRNPATISSIAIHTAEKVVGHLPAKHVVVLGAGEMAELAVEALRTRGVQHITVVNRTQERAAQLAARWQAQALTFEHLAATLAQADIVIASTGAPHYVITPDLAQAAMHQRPQRPLALIDIAVPRNVDPAINQIPSVHAYDIDDLQNYLNGSLAGRQHAVPQVEAIIAQEVNAFGQWRRGLEVQPLIAELRAKADAIRQNEIERTLRHLPHLGPVEREHIEALTEALINKLLHEPTLRLRAEATNGHAAEYAQTVRYLFDL